MVFDSPLNHAMDKDTVQISKLEYAKKMTPAAQGLTNAQHYTRAVEPVMGCIQDPSAEAPRGMQA